MKPNPPPPDVHSIPRYHSESVLEIVFSRTKERRAVICRDGEGLYRVHTDYWCIADFDFIGEGYWAQDDRFATITDTPERAKQLAHEALGNHDE